MRVSSDISRGIPPGRVQDKLSKRYQLEAKYLSDNAQSDPVKILFGRDFLPMTLLTPVFDLFTRESGGGGKGASKAGGAGQEVYYGGFAAAFCVGPVKAVHAIYDSDTELLSWAEEGFRLGYHSDTDIWDATGEYNIVEVPDYGVLRLHRGTDSQPVDPRFTNGKPILIDLDNEDSTIPAMAASQTGYRNTFYVVADSFKLGSSNITPNLRIEVSCLPQAFVADAGELPDWFKLTDAEGDVWPPLIIYEYLRNEAWGGAGLTAADIDFDSFLAATEQCITEGVAITALQDAAGTTLRDAISQVLQYCDGVLFLDHESKIALRLVRTPSDISNLPEITTAELAQEPLINFGGADEAWGRTEIVFSSRVDSYETTAEVFESPRYVGSPLKEIKTNTLNLPFCKQRLLAAKLARRFAAAGAEPSAEVEMSVLPGVDYKVGDLIFLTYPPLNISRMLLRINRVESGSSIEPLTHLTAVLQPEASWQIEIQNLVIGFEKQQEQQNKIAGGYFKPRTLLLNDAGDGQELAVFAERPEAGAVKGYEADIINGEQYPDGSPVRALSTGDRYQTQIEITSLEKATNGLMLAMRVEGGKRHDELANLTKSRQDGGVVYVTACTFEDGERTLAPMTFSVTKIDYKNKQSIDEVDYYLYQLLVQPAQVYPNFQYPSTADNRVPSKTAYIYRAESLLCPNIDFKQLFYDMESKLYLKADFGGGLKEDNPCGFHQIYSGSVISHSLGTLGEVFYDAWGSPLSIAQNLVITVAASPPEAPDPEDDNIYINPVTGENYAWGVGGWQMFGQSEVLEPVLKSHQIPFGKGHDEVARGDHDHDERYQLIGSGSSSEQYYLRKTASDSITHNEGSNGIIHCHIESEDSFAIELSDPDEASTGDTIQIIVTKAAAVSKNTVKIELADGYFTAPEVEQFETFDVTTGSATTLLCALASGGKRWAVLRKPII